LNPALTELGDLVVRPAKNCFQIDAEDNWV